MNFVALLRKPYLIIPAVYVLVIVTFLVQNPEILSSGRGSGSGVSPVRTDMRSVATALETYYLDFGVYPPAEGDEFLSHHLTTPNVYISKLPPDYFKVNKYFPYHRSHIWIVIVFCTTISIYVVYLLKMKILTQGISLWKKTGMLLSLAGVYILLFFLFPIKEFQKRRIVRYENHTEIEYRFNYATDADSFFLIQSVGLDGDRDLKDMQKFLDEQNDIKSLRVELITKYSYDSTNGTISSGDVFRMKD